MNVRRFINAIFVLGLFWILCWQPGGSFFETKAAQIIDLPKNARIVVADRPLTGPFSLPQQRGNRMFLPAVSIARALGDSVTVDSGARNLEVRRQTGVVAIFDARQNQVRENGSIVMVVSDTADIVFPPNPDELMLPIEIMAPLLDVSIILD